VSAAAQANGAEVSAVSNTGVTFSATLDAKALLLPLSRLQPDDLVRASNIAEVPERTRQSKFGALLPAALRARVDRSAFFDLEAATRALQDGVRLVQ
jgi:hypothetical protein